MASAARGPGLATKARMSLEISATLSSPDCW
jgi:hypothetical protein